jgi:hypothetical protein
MRGLALAALSLCACDRRAPITACSDDLRGVYAVLPAPGVPGATQHPDAAVRWMVLDNRRSLEVYPLFDDTVEPAPGLAPGLEIAPRYFDLHRTPDGLVGEVRRRYLRGSERCDARAPARILACTSDTLELELADPTPPIGFAPCAWGQPAPTRRERWRRP